MPAAATSFVSMVATSPLVLPVAVVSAPTAVPGVRALLSVAALGVVGTALAFVIYYQLIADVGAGRASLVSYLAPGVALFYGAAFYDEPITLAAVAGLAPIVGGVALASRSPRAALSRAGSGRRPGASRPRR
jgi:drug/metabolite transporter (DMT)-like permease